MKKGIHNGIQRKEFITEFKKKGIPDGFRRKKYITKIGFKTEFLLHILGNCHLSHTYTYLHAIFENKVPSWLRQGLNLYSDQSAIIEEYLQNYFL